MLRRILALILCVTMLGAVVPAYSEDTPDTPSYEESAPAAGALDEASDAAPTEAPTAAPTEAPTEEPTAAPTEAPTEEPTAALTEAPTEEPTAAPTEAPTEEPTAAPTESPAEEPTFEPTEVPTEEPTFEPTEAPTEEPTFEPTEAPTEEPTFEPTEAPTEEPTEEPEATPEPEPLEITLTAAVRSAFASDAVKLTLTIKGGAGALAAAYQVRDGGAQLVSESGPKAIADGQDTFVFTPAAHGDHTVLVAVTDEAGQTAQAAVTVPVAEHDTASLAKWSALARAVTLSGDWRKDVVAVAKTQVGYAASATDFVILEDGVRHAYSIYGDYDDEWYAAFVAFCMEYAKVPSSAFPRSATAAQMLSGVKAKGAFESVGYAPSAGDVVFFQNGQRQPERVGIVTAASDASVQVVEVMGGAVVSKSHRLDDAAIMGYASMEAVMIRAGMLEEATAAPTETPAVAEAPTEAPVATVAPTETPALPAMPTIIPGMIGPMIPPAPTATIEAAPEETVGPEEIPGPAGEALEVPADTAGPEGGEAAGIAPMLLDVPQDVNGSLGDSDWILKTIDGKTITKSTYAGKTVLYVFYRATMSGGSGQCANSNGVISGLAKSSWISASDIKIIALDVDSNTSSAVQAYKNTYAPDCGYIDFTYGDASELLSYFKTLAGSSATTLAFCAVVKNNALKYFWGGAASAERCQSALSQLSSVPEPDDNRTLEEAVADVIAEGSYHQTPARAMLTQVNDLRTGSDAWYWNADDATKTVLTDLTGLHYDYALEQIAMQRAAELVLSYSHTRPNGTSCFTLSYDGIHSYGENIAYGYTSTQAMFEGWAELNEPYSGQGHRRNMLNSHYTSIGIACFFHEGRFYWVQEFGYSHSGVSDQVPDATSPSGTLANGIEWSISNGVLTISGNGTLEASGNGMMPWSVCPFTSVVFTGNITGICEFAFYDCEKLTSITFPSSIKSIDYFAIVDCPRLTSVTVKNPDCYIGGMGYFDGTPTCALGNEKKVTLTGFPGSTAAQYAARYGYAFKELQLDTPKLTSVENTANGVKFTWSKVADAVNYCVFYKTGSGSWTRLAATSSTSYTWTGAQSGTAYTFSVRCASKDGGSYYSAYNTTGLSITYIAPPKLSDVSNAADGVKIAWGKVSGAEKYRVFCKTGSGSWTKLADTAAASYTWTGAKSGSTYAFTVQCVNSAGTAATSAYDTTGKSITYVAAPKISGVSNTVDGVQIDWAKVNGAAKYRVFYKTGSGSWTKIADTAAASYTWTGAQSGSTYAFTVQCVNSAGTAATSAYDTVGKSMTYIAAPKLSSVAATVDGVQIKWGKVSGAAKYRVFYKSGSGGWKKIADTAAASYTWTGAQSGVKYAFTVRCVNSAGTDFTSAYDTAGKSLTYIAAPRLTSVAGTVNGVQITWGKVSGAAKYRVFYKNSSGGWSKLADTADSTYTWTGAKSGTAYTFTVRCVNSAGTDFTSAYDAVGKSLTYIAAPRIASVTRSGSGIKITWGKVSGAAKYRVFYRNSAGVWTKLADTASNSYTWTGASADTIYTFTVRCLDSAGTAYTSAFDSIGKSAAVTAAPKLSSAVNTADGVQIKWGKVPGAEKYRVFYKTSGGWKKIGDTASTSYVWTGAKSGAEYTFTVRCVNRDGTAFTSAFDAVGKSVTYVAAPKISGLTSSGSSVKITWDKVAGAAKYRVFYTTGSGSWKTLGDTASTSYTWTGGTSGATYTFTVRCVSGDGKTFTSAFDAAGKSIVR